VDKAEGGLEIKVEEKSGAKGLDKEADQEAWERVEQKVEDEGDDIVYDQGEEKNDKEAE